MQNRRGNPRGCPVRKDCAVIGQPHHRATTRVALTTIYIVSKIIKKDKIVVQKAVCVNSKLQSKVLGDLIIFSNGRTSPERFENGAYPVFGSNGLIGKANEFNTPSNSIVIGRVGSYCGAVHFSEEPCWVTDNAIKASAKEENNPKFLFYLLKQLNLNTWRSGSGQPLINQATLNAIKVSVPKQREQKEISTILSSLDDRIALLRETNKTLEAIAQALFKSWFIDFDPVRAKMENKIPEGMDEETAALFPDSFEESELGMIPKGWRVGTFRETVNIIGGGTPKTSNPDFWGGDIPWFSVVDAPKISDIFVINTEKKITEAGLNNSSTKLLPIGTTIISARGTVGRLALTGCSMAMNQSCYGLRGYLEDIYFTYFNTKRLIEKFKQRAHGSVFDTITQESFSGVFVCIPTNDSIGAFENAVEPIMLRIRTNCIQTQTLANLRDTLLPNLISGKIRV